MAAYCGSIGSVNVLEFVSTDLFDESQENPFLLQQQQKCSSAGGGYTTSSNSKASPSPLSSPLRSSLSPMGKSQCVRFAELPLNDQSDPLYYPDEHDPPAAAPPSPKKSVTWSSSPSKRQSATMMSSSPMRSSAATASCVVVPTPTPPLSPQANAFLPPHPSPSSTAANHRQSIAISLPYAMFNRQASGDSNASTTASQVDHDAITLEETELRKLLYSLSRLGLGQPSSSLDTPPQAGAPSLQFPSQGGTRPLGYYEEPSSPLQQSYASTISAPTSPLSLSSSSLWLPGQVASRGPIGNGTTEEPKAGTAAALMFRSMPNRQSRRLSSRQSTSHKRFSSAPNSPARNYGAQGNDQFFPDDAMDHVDEDHATIGDGVGMQVEEGYRSQPASPSAHPHHNSRGSVTFLTVKNLLRGGGALARTVRHEQPIRRPTCMGKELTVSSRLKQRQKFQRPTVITDAYHRVSGMKLGTSPMKVKIKHMAFPQSFSTTADDEELISSSYSQGEADAGMSSSPKRQLRKESLITLETLDKIGTRHACPVQLIEEPLPDFSMVQPRVDAWNNQYKKPKQKLRRPSAWLLGADRDRDHGAS